MSESLTEDTKSIEQTESLSEKNYEDEVKAQEILTPCNTRGEENQHEKPVNLTESIDQPVEVPQVNQNEKPENLIGSKDTTVEEVSEEKKSLPFTTTEITKSPVKSSEKEETDTFVLITQKTLHEQHTVKQENIEKNIEEVQYDKDSSSDDATTEIPKLTQKSSTRGESLIENQDNHIDNSSTAQENPQNKIATETTIKETTASSLTPSEEKIPQDKKSIDISLRSQVTPQDKDSLKGDCIENQNKDKVDTSSTAQVTPQSSANNPAASAEKPSSKDEYAEHVTYNEDGSAIYTDPKTKYQYKWCTKENNWIPCDANSSTTNPYENEHYKWCSETEKWLPKNTQVTETEHYKWDAEKNEWIAKVKEATSSELTNRKEIAYDIDEDGLRTYTDEDGTAFFWDVEKNAWFPKIDDDFMARYQMSYGFIDNTSESVREKEQLELKNKLLQEQELKRLVEEAKASDEASNDKQGVKRKAQQEPPKWFDIDPSQNTKVYVSNLPSDITLDEFVDVMGKCGMIMRDPQTQKYKLKLYTEADGQMKGDGLCDYIKVESVDLALKILDEYEIRGHKIRVQRAQFQMRGEYNPALKPKRKKKDKEKLAKIKEKLFDWRPEKMRGERSKHEKTVIIKNLFHPELFEREVQLILDYQNDLREECGKCGTVRKVVIYDRHLEGVAQVNMSSPEEADLVIQMMQGRFFGKRQLTADHWDGKTKYKIEETEEEIQKRLNKWDQYLETEENKKSDVQKDKQNIEENKKSDLEEIQKSDLQKDAEDLEKNKISDLQIEKTGINENEKSDLQKEEQDIEKTINFENCEKSQVTKNDVEDSQLTEEN